MSEDAPAPPMSIRARIAAMKLEQPDTPPPSYDAAIGRKSKPPPPPLPNRPQSTNNPPILRPNGVTIGNQPAASKPSPPLPSREGILPAPSFKKWEKTESPTPDSPPRRPTHYSTDSRRTSTASVASNGRPVPPLPPRRPSESQSLVRKQSVESISSIGSGRTSVSGLSTRTSFSVASRNPEGHSKNRVRAPEYDPANLPALPEKRQNVPEKGNGRLALLPTTSLPNGISQIGRRPSMEPPALPGRPPLPARRDTKVEEAPKPRRSALEWGMNKTTSQPPPVPSSRPTENGGMGPPAVPISAPSAEPALTELTSANFDSVILHSGKPAFVDFFAYFCGPCKEFAPTYQKLADSFHNSPIIIAKIDSYQNKEIGERYGIECWPTLKFFDGHGGIEDYKSSWDLECLQKFITKKTGFRPGAAPSLSSPPPVPVSSRPNLAELQKSKPKFGATNGGSNGAAPAGAGQCMKCRDFSGPDNHAARFPRQSIPSNDVNWLGHQLCDQFSSPTDKARAIFTWLHHNVEYDVVAFFNHNVQPSTPKSTFATGLAVCEGYAALFTALATAAGLESVVVGGHGKGFGHKAGGPIPPRNPTGHAWNAVKIDNGAWKLIDPCWGAGNIKGKGQPYNKQFSPEHFTKSNDEFGLSHFPEDSRWFLRDDGRPTISWEEYMTSDGTQQKCLVYSPAKTDLGLDDQSFEPKFMDVRRDDPTAGPTVRFMFHKICPHYDITAKHGPPYHYYIKIGEEERYFESDGYWWWCDVTRQELGKCANGTVVCEYVNRYGLDSKSTRGMSLEEVREKRGWRSWGMSHVAMWKVV
ncbi:Dihydroxyacetone kinase 1 [Venturia inaequalis]|nr:Dihydroxyacetone kinase 1 [Venturia inaequalis]